MIKRKDVETYFKQCYDDYATVLNENSTSSLVFSYLMGMLPEECRYMYPETDWTVDELRQYDDVEGIVLQLQREIRNKT